MHCLISERSPARRRCIARRSAPYEQLGDPAALQCALKLADLGRERGETAAAIPVYERAIAVYRQAGNEYELADKLNSLAQLTNELGDGSDRAMQLYDEALRHFRAIGEREGVGNILSNQADILLARGDLAGAASHYQEAHDLFVAVGMHAYEVQAVGDLGIVLLRGGHFDDARTKLITATTALRELGDRDHLLVYLAALGDLEREQDHPDRARAFYEEAIALARSAHAVASELQLTLLEAELQFSEGDAAGAIKRLSARLGRDDTAHVPMVWLAEPHAPWARALLKTGDVRGAQQLVAQAVVELGTTVQDNAGGLVLRTAAEVLAATNCDGALRSARAVVAVDRQQLDLRYEAELSLAWIERRCGAPGAARRARALTEQARQAGYARIARLATGLR